MAKSNSFYLFLLYFSIIIEFVPLIIGLTNFKYLKKADKFILLLLGVSVFTEVISRIISVFFNHTNTVIYNFYIIIETILISLYYIRVFDFKKLKIMFSCLCFIHFSASFIEFYEVKNEHMNNISITIESIMIMFFTLVTFFYMLKSPPADNILDAPIFWINSAFLLYFAGGLFLHLFMAYLVKHALETFYSLWGPWHSSLNIVFYSLISIGLWKTRKLQL